MDLVEGADYYFERGLMVFTAAYLLRRGYCCGSGCRHCPYEGGLPMNGKKPRRLIRGPSARNGYSPAEAREQEER